MKMYASRSAEPNLTTAPSRAASSKAAFTLIEVVLSIVVLVIGTSATILVMTTALNRVASGEEKMQAMHTARHQLEALRVLPYNHSTLEDGDHSNDVLHVSYTVEDDLGNDDIKRISIQAPWYNHVRRTNQILTIDTILCDPLH